MNIDIVLSWPKEYIVYRDRESGNGNPHTGQGAERSGVSGLSGGFAPPIAVFASEQANADIFQELFRQHVVPWAQRDVA
jgi:hypothetical protein